MTAMKHTYPLSSLIRSFNYKVTVTSLLFSADGASLYIGTEDGKLLLQTLRSMEAPKVITVGEQGCRVEGLAIAVRPSLLSLGYKSHFFTRV
jgi:protein NEDD1